VVVIDYKLTKGRAKISGRIRADDLPALILALVAKGWAE
jgi:hypothetical protein